MYTLNRCLKTSVTHVKMLQEAQTSSQDFQSSDYTVRSSQSNNGEWNLPLSDSAPSHSNTASQEKDFNNYNSFQCNCGALPLSFPDSAWNNVGYAPYNSQYTASACCLLEQQGKKQSDVSSLSQVLPDPDLSIQSNIKDLSSDIKQYEFPTSSCMKQLPSNSNDCSRVLNYVQSSMFNSQFTNQDPSIVYNSQYSSNSGNGYGLCLESDCLDKLCSPSKQQFQPTFSEAIDVDSRMDLSSRLPSTDFSSDFSHIINVTNIDNSILKERDSDGSSDIIVEDSDTESEISIDTVPFNKREIDVEKVRMRCFVCNICYIDNLGKNFVEVSSCAPLTFISQTPVMLKLIEIIPVEMQTSIKFENSLICRRCLNLIDVIENLEVRLDGFKKAICDFVSRSNRDICEEEWKTEKANDLRENYKKTDDTTCKNNEKSTVGPEKVTEAVLNAGIISEKEEEEDLYVSQSCHMCDRCGKIYRREKELLAHLDKHAGIFTEHCLICGRGFHKKSSLEVHMRIHRSYACTQCIASFTQQAELDAHIKVCTNNRFPCNHCSLVFTKQEILDRHKEKHTTALKICTVCSKSFKHQSELSSHMDSHSDKKPFSCTKCDKSYKKQSHLRRHMKLHETYFKCVKCPAVFTNSVHFRKHMTIHLDRLECSICLKTFVDKKTLLGHKKMVHSELSSNKECSICHKLIKNNLKVHMLTHSAKKHFKCELCNIEFTFKQSLIKHNKQKHNNS